MHKRKGIHFDPLDLLDSGSNSRKKTLEKMIQLLMAQEAIIKIIACVKEAKHSIELLNYIATMPSIRSSINFRNLHESMKIAGKKKIICNAIFSKGEKNSSLNASNERVMQSLKESNWNCKTIDGARILHGKAWIFDSRLIVIGSHNLTESAMTKNIEFSVITDDPTVMQKMNSMYREKFQEAKPYV